MKKIFLVLFLLLPIILPAQEANLHLSNEFKLRIDGTMNQVMDKRFGYKAGNFFYRFQNDFAGSKLVFTAELSRIKHAIILYKYDSNMAEIKKLSLENGNKVFGPFESQMLLFNNKLLLFYYKYYEDESLKLFVTEINKETLEAENTKELIALSQKNFSGFKLSKVEDENKSFLVISPDSNKIMLMHATPGNIFSCIIDRNMNIINKTVSKVPVYKRFYPQSAFVDNAGNKYFSYKYIEEDTKVFERGFFVANVSGKGSFQTIAINQEDYKTSDLNFESSNDNTKVYVYANYFSETLNTGLGIAAGNINKFETEQNEGIAIATVNIDKLKAESIKLYPYPDDIKQKLYKLDCGSKTKGKFHVNTINFAFHEFEDGTIGMIGSPFFFQSRVTRDGWGATDTNVGSIVSILIKKQNLNIAVIPRSQAYSEGSDCIALFSKDNIVCIYTDDPKNIEAPISDKVKEAPLPHYLGLAVAIISKDGTILSRNKIADDAIKRNYYFTCIMQKLSNNTFLIPIGSTEAKIGKYVSDFVQWGEVEVN